MNSPCSIPTRLRQLVLAHACVLLAVPLVLAQQAPTPNQAKLEQDAKALAKYDKNKNGKLDQSELDAMAADEANSASSASGDAIVLSPFEVTAENNGYMATNSASGTRLNSALSDLASPISVVTKQQLQDMAAVDLNDIFRSETNVEGLYQYTEIGFDRNQVVDTASNNPEANNRIRGMGQANLTSGGMSVSSAISVDAYNIDSAEISRGANSNIFGIGSTSGTVNLNMSTGNMTRDFTKFSFRVDSEGGHRETADFNRVLIRNKLALRVIGAYGERGFVREPSYDKDKRFTIALRAQPFKNTGVKVSYETVRQRQSLPNMMTPREAITSWREFGAQTWDPSTATLYNSSGGVIGVYSGIRAPANGLGGNALVTNYRLQGGSGSSDNQRPVIGYIDGQIAYWTGTGSWNFNRRNATTGDNTYDQTGNQRLVDYQVPGAQIYVPEINPTTGQPFGLMSTAFNEQLIGIHGEAGKAIYDWTKYNINASNRAQKRSNVVRAEIEQNLFKSERQQLALQLAGIYENIDNKSWNFIGNGGDGVQGIVYIDVNRTLPNGSANPGYLRPYIRARQPQRYDRPEENTIFKAQLAYLFDMSRNQGWTKWVGKHNFLGYGEERVKKFSPNSLRYRSQLINGVDGPLERTVGNSDSLNTRYYLGDASGFNIDNPTTSPPTSGVFPYTYWSTEFGGNGATRFDDPKFRTANARMEEVHFAFGTQKNEIRTVGGIWQGFFWDGRIVPTLGWRKDKVRFAPSKPWGGGNPFVVNPVNAYTIPGFPAATFTNPNPALFDFAENYIVTNPRLGLTENKGQTRTQGIVLKPLRGLTRSRILNGLSLTYNRAASFEPAGLAIDTYGDIVENPTGKSEDYGVRFSLFNDRLWIGLNKYKAMTTNARNGGANVVATRAIPFDVDTGEGDPDNSFGGVTSGNQKDLFDWYYFRIFGNTSTGVGQNVNLVPGFNGTGDIGYMQTKGLIGATDAETRQRVTDHVFDLMKYDKDIIRKRFNAPGATNTATNDVTSQGYELEVLYRTKNWNLKVTGAKKETIDSNIAGSLTRYIEERQPVLEKASYTNTATGVTESYWNSSFAAGGPTHGNSYFSEVYSVYNPLVANLGKPRPQIRTYSAAVTTSYNLAGISDNKYLKNIRTGGGLSWVSKGSIGYRYALPIADPVTGVYAINKLDPNKPIYDKARYSASAWAAYDFRMFNGRIKSSVQLNVQNLLEDGRLQPVASRTDGQPWAYRIVDPRLFQLTWNLEL